MTTNTPHVGEYTPVTPETDNRAREVQEAVQLIHKLTEGLSMQARRQIKSSVELILKN